MIAMLIRTLNEEHQIAECMRHHLPYVNYIYVLDGGSTDNTVREANTLANKVVEDRSKDFGDFTTRAIADIPKIYEWVLICDTDERFDPDFLRLMRPLMENHPTTSFRFPRLNLPHAKDYPDYQTRLMRTDKGIVWVNPVHEVPTLEGVLLSKVSCLTVHKYPIIHKARRDNIKRPWWIDDE
jgi:glycosyltransferase involved in cell wall biosynthesis